MFCTKCGHKNASGARFCEKCGTPLTQAETPAPQSSASGAEEQPMQPSTIASPKKRGKGLLIGLIAGGVVLIAAVVLIYFLLFAGTPVLGTWYNDEAGVVLEFDKDGEVTCYTLEGMEKAEYEYDKNKREGSVFVEDTTTQIILDGDRLKYETDYESYRFERTDKEADIETLVMSGLLGIWYSEDLGEVLVLEDDEVLRVHSAFGEFEGAYTYDIDDGEGTMKLNGKEYSFSASVDELDIDTVGSYVNGERDFDIDAFLSQFGNPLIGTWYDPEGFHGAVFFNEDNTFELESFGVVISGTYTYDGPTSSGTVTLETGDTTEFTLSDGTLMLDGVGFTQEYTPQKGADDVFEPLVGLWYDADGILGTIEFYADGNADIDLEGEYYEATVVFNPIDMTGVVQVDGWEDTEISLNNDFLTVGAKTYTKNYVLQAYKSVCGMWYDMNGEKGTLFFYEDGTVEMVTYGQYFFGTYTFDPIIGEGSMTINVGGEPLSTDIYLDPGFLSVEGVVYSHNEVEQAAYVE